MPGRRARGGEQHSGNGLVTEKAREPERAEPILGHGVRQSPVGFQQRLHALGVSQGAGLENIQSAT
jgi:hypothetical protein